MEYLFILIVLIGSILGLYFLLKKQITQNSKNNNIELESKLESFIDAFKLTSAENLNKQLQDSKQDQKNMEIRFSETINNLTKELEKIKGTNEQVLTFANQMKTLEKILGNQKQRGILGEIQLENLLANVLPPELFQMQYSFNNGEAVDAVIKVGEFIIPIDAKFSLDNYNKMIESDETETDKLNDLEKKFKNDIKNRIDETSKYIRPNEKTVDYAYMFIPADGLYQDLLNNKVGSLKINQRDLVSYAYQKKVMIVSPMSLFPMLQVTNKALNNMKVEESINEIQMNIEKLGNHLNAYLTYHEKLGNSISTVVNHYNVTNKEFKKIDKDITKLTSGKSTIGIETENIDRPLIEK
ncbi:MAG: DNA recombination protein RmuC [Bacteroidetes bacterium]|nr:DNA recombination protein RmuC [Bacteroidota bacterium]MDA0885130.1 DNA recombination protein RmuC [Bacteroidota bacterium]MDA1225292.1 DNA recombination protein RmuC [Bacteroidota bacterium]